MDISVFSLFLAVQGTVYTPETSSVPRWADKAYDEEIVFDVKRKGRKIGTHRVSFRQDKEGLYVDTETDLKVRFLFFTAYRFQYDSREFWDGDRLKRLEAVTDDGGKVSQYVMKFGEETLEVDGGGRTVSYDVGAPLYPTNHWHPLVLQSSKVINTISGKVNDVTITPGGWENVPAGQGERRALRFDYEGDLKDVSAWYDEEGRWVGLRFRARDGSDIVYECQRCGS